MFTNLRHIWISTAGASVILAVIAVLTFGADASIEEEISSRQLQIEEIEKQIAEYEKEIESTKGTARTLQSEVDVLNAQIRQYELSIRALELSIGQVTNEIQTTESGIIKSENEIEKHKNAMAQFIRITNDFDQKTMIYAILSDGSISDFFNNINAVQINQEKLTATVKFIKKAKSELEEKQYVLEDKRVELNQSRSLEAVEKGNLDSTKTSVAKLLKDTKGQEVKFQDMLKQSQKDIEAIRAQIRYLELNGISAEEAVKFGQLAAIGAGIRPAFLIALLEFESGLGRNVGQCYLKDPVTANGINIKTGAVVKRVMKPMGLAGRKGDVDDFLVITAELGRDPFNTPVSCPQSVGYGGAMGPAQFIPTTWVGYKDEVIGITGHNPPDPWNIEDAFTASAVKLARGGATVQTRDAEIRAAKIYYSGRSSCSTYACNSYANGIQRIASEIEKNL